MPPPTSTVRNANPDTAQLTAWAGALAALICGLCLLLPRLGGDATVYALLAKQIATSGDWVNLVYQGKDWLDKPHFPFWMVALSFKLFGINERAYLVPGLLFFVLGAWSTRKLAQHFFDARTAAVAALLYLGVLGSLLAAIDQKAEVYLLGLLPSASYCWLRFEQRASWRHGLLGALLTACALMTKGIFVLVILGVGLFALLVFRRAWSRLFHWKWLAAAAGVALFLLPELVSLYLQFDRQPDKLVFGRTQVSGLRFFFWDSQFGRFFNTGPIQNQKGSPWFFVHNLIWTFFPWLLALLAAGAAALRQAVARAPVDDDGAQVFLWATFLTTFALFSATSYQMDFYLPIVFPYAVILCARWLVANEHRLPAAWWRTQVALTGLVLLLALGLSVVHAVKCGLNLTLALAVGLSGVAIGVLLKRRPPFALVLVVGLSAVIALFAFAIQFQRDLYVGYNTGRQAALYLNTQPAHRVVVAIPDLKPFAFMVESPVLRLDGAAAVAEHLKRDADPDRTVYLLVYADQADDFVQALRAESLPLQVEPVQTFVDIELPKQFIVKLLRDDAALERRAIQLLRLTATIR